MNAQTVSTAQKALVNLSVDDDGMLLWLNDHSDAATGFVKNYPLTHSGTDNDINGNPRPYTQSGLASVLAGRDAAAYLGVAPSDARVPDIVGISRYVTPRWGSPRSPPPSSSCSACRRTRCRRCRSSAPALPTRRPPGPSPPRPAPRRRGGPSR